MAGRHLLIGIGNPHRGDDGVGPAVAARLRGHAGHQLEVLAHDGEAATLVELLAQAGVAYLVDAAVSRSPPGTIHRFDVGLAPLPNRVLAVSTHGLGVGEAIELARSMGSLPATCVVFAVEGATFRTGDATLSPRVECAADEVTQRILAETSQLPERRPAPPGNQAHRPGDGTRR